MRFEFATASRILFGPGSVAEAGAAAAGIGRRVFVVRGRDAVRASPLYDALSAAGLELESFVLTGEPSFDDIRAALSQARAFGAELTIGFGGGSCIDAAKAVAVLLANPGEPLDYAEVIGAGKALSLPALPCIAVPTTAGTGSEVTRNAVLSSALHRVKVSLRSATMLPRLAIVDSELDLGMPPSVTASTGMDALTQLIEPFVSRRANPFSDSFCRDGIGRAFECLPRAFRDGSDAGAREGMALASLEGGLALANAGLGAVHGLAAPIGGAFDAPHGAICAALLPHATAVNIRALRAREGSNPALARYAEIASMLSGKTGAGPEEARPEAAAEALLSLVAELKIPGLSAWGLGRSDFAELARKGEAASSMKANPIVLEAREIEEILELAF